MLPNKAKFDWAEIETIFGNDSLINIDEKWACTGVIIDSRICEKDNIFVALNGEKIDGHDKCSDAFASGAAACVVNHSWYQLNKSDYPDKSFVLCDDTLVAFGKLAKFHRLRFDFPVLAIAGSNGKTTTKEMTAAVLSQKFKLLKTHENFNNRLGVPLMLLQFSDEYDAAVLEIGTNEPGEIHILSDMTSPTHGLITNIGLEHLEKLIDLDGVEQEETALFGHLLKKGGTCLVNTSDERLAKYLPVLSKKFTYGGEEALIKSKITLDANIIPSIEVSYHHENYTVKLKSPGHGAAYNAVAAIAAGVAFDLSPEQIKTGIESFVQASDHGYARMTVSKSGIHTILNDCYNANPTSMKLALTTLADYSASSYKIACLGDMREMGDASRHEHRAVLKYALQTADEILTIGEEMKKAANDIKDVRIITFENHDKAAEYLSLFEKPSVILVKGSRGMKMETIIDGLNK